MGDIDVRAADEVESIETSPGVSRQLVFETEDTTVVRSLVAGGVTTGWHHNGDRHVYGYVVEGSAVLEYGPNGRDAVELDAGSFVHVPPRTIRRVVNPTDDDWSILSAVRRSRFSPTRGGENLHTVTADSISS